MTSGSSNVTSSNRTPVVIFGAGGLAREVAWVLGMPGAVLRLPDGQQLLYGQVVGHLDDREEMHGTDVNERPVLGGSEWLADHPGHAVVVAVGNPDARRGIVERLRALGAAFPSILAPDTFIGDKSTISEGVIALPGVIITCNVNIGSFVLLNPHASISHDGEVGDFTSLGPGVSLAGNARIGSGCDIGTNASLIPGISIGSDVVIGAGACVVRNLPDGVTAVGVPARVTSRLEMNQEF